MDPEESRMRAAAHHMVRFMTAGMALITCREPLLVSITNTLRSSLQTAFRVSANVISFGKDYDFSTNLRKLLSYTSSSSSIILCHFVIITNTAFSSLLCIRF